MRLNALSSAFACSFLGSTCAEPVGLLSVVADATIYCSLALTAGPWLTPWHCQATLGDIHGSSLRGPRRDKGA